LNQDEKKEDPGKETIVIKKMRAMAHGTEPGEIDELTVLLRRPT
jgi:hypothetical protein